MITYLQAIKLSYKILKKEREKKKTTCVVLSVCVWVLSVLCLTHKEKN